MPVSACAAVGSLSCCAAFVWRRSLENACFRSLDASFFLHALSSRASFGAALVASARYQVSSAVLRCVLCNVSERRSYTRATKVDAAGMPWLVRGRLSVNRDLEHQCSALPPGLASLPQRKGRCVRVEPLVFRRARAAAFARSGVQSAEWRAQGHKTTSRVPQERSFARGKTNNSQSKQVLIALRSRLICVDLGPSRDPTLTLSHISCEIDTS